MSVSCAGRARAELILARRYAERAYLLGAWALGPSRMGCVCRARVPQSTGMINADARYIGTPIVERRFALAARALSTYSPVALTHAPWQA